MLDINNLSVIFNKDTINQKIALDNLSLHVNGGEFVTIIGSNGAGKSTLFQAISGAIKQTNGTIFLDNKDIGDEKEYKRSRIIGRLFQDPLKGTAPHMTIEENLKLAYSRGKHYSLRPLSNKDRDVFKQALKSLDIGLEDRLDVKVGELSGGQRQALTLLMATLVPPKLLLLDEHTAALDPSASQKVLELSNKIVRENHITTMMITHDMDYALKYGDRLLMMKDGHIVLDMSKKEKESMNVEDLIHKFMTIVESNDRILLKA